MIRFAPNLAWRDVPLVEASARRSGCRRSPTTTRHGRRLGGVPVRGGARVPAHAAGRRGHRASAAASSLDGTLYRGAHGFAAEIGHIVVEPGGPLCGCGNRGCWEQVASGTAIMRAGRRGGDAAPALGARGARRRRPGRGDRRDGDRGRARGRTVRRGHPRGGRPPAGCGHRRARERARPRAGRGRRRRVRGGRPAARARAGRLPRLGRGAEHARRCRSCRRPSATMPARSGRPRSRSSVDGAPRVRLGVSLPVFTGDPSKPLEVAARAAAARLRRASSRPTTSSRRCSTRRRAPTGPRSRCSPCSSAVAAREPGLHVGHARHPRHLAPAGLLAKQAAALDACRGGRASSASAPATEPRPRSTRRSGSLPAAAERRARSRRRSRRCARCSRATRGRAGARAGDHRSAAAARRARDLGRRAVRRGASSRRAGRRCVERVGPRRRGVRRAGGARCGARRGARWSRRPGRASRWSVRTAPISTGSADARRGACRSTASGAAPRGEWRRVRRWLAAAGATWCVVLPAGPRRPARRDRGGADRADEQRRAQAREARGATPRARRRDAMPAGPSAHWRAWSAERFLDCPRWTRRHGDGVLVVRLGAADRAVARSVLARGAPVALPRIVDGELEPRSTGRRRGERDVVRRARADRRRGVDRGRDRRGRRARGRVRPAGRRVGYGGGFYDRFLPRSALGAPRIGIGYAVQLLPPGQSCRRAVRPAGRRDRDRVRDGAMPPGGLNGMAALPATPGVACEGRDWRDARFARSTSRRPASTSARRGRVVRRRARRRRPRAPGETRCTS